MLYKLNSPFYKRTTKESLINWIVCRICTVWVYEDFDANEA